MKKGIDYPAITVVFFCHDGKGNFLLAKRTDRTRDEHNLWEVGGGAVEHGETIESTLKREVEEEYATSVISHEFLGYHDIHRELNGKRTHWIALVFKVLIDKKKAINNEPEKISEIKWFKLDNLPQKLHTQLPILIEKFRGKL